MTDNRRHPETEADRRADRRTWVFFSLFLLASYFVESLSDRDDLMRLNAGNPDTPWLSQATSHLVILAMTPFITTMLSRFPLTAWRRTLPVHLAAVAAFSAIHVLAMVTLRSLLSPVILGEPYRVDLADPSMWLYEFRKDVLTYTLIAAIFWISRLAEQRSMETRAVKAEASERHRLTLKSGGRTFFVNASDIAWVRAAGNYVEVVTPGRTYLARATLSELESLLAAAGGRHVRVHRSHIVDLDRVQAIEPTGEGDATLTLATGDRVPGSRRYRERYKSA